MVSTNTIFGNHVLLHTRNAQTAFLPSSAVVFYHTLAEVVVNIDLPALYAVGNADATLEIVGIYGARKAVGGTVCKSDGFSSVSKGVTQPTGPNISS